MAMPKLFVMFASMVSRSEIVENLGIFGEILFRKLLG